MTSDPSLSGLCRHPKCYRTLKGLRGLNIHLGQSAACAAWYKANAGRLPPFHEQTQPMESGVDAAEDGRLSPVPWTLKAQSEGHSAPKARSGRSVTVEDFDDGGLGDIDEEEESPSRPVQVKSHPTAGRIYGKGRSILQEIDDNLDYKFERKTNIYYPFVSREDFEMGAWLSQSSISMSQIDAFLKLPYITQRGGLSFRTAQELNTKLSMLPSPPAWKSRVVTVPGGTTKEPIVLYYRDGLEVFKSLFGNSLFEGHQDFVPSKIWSDPENDIRVFEGPFTGDLTYEIQDQVDAGETLGLVMISSDATLLTNIAGNKKAHCVYMSCGNIRKEVRSKASARCWVKIAEIPQAYFNEVSSRRVLCQRLYHICMDIITESLKRSSHSPIHMTDANGDDRLVRTILFVHLADLPEQLTISCCHGGALPISVARSNEFGSGKKAAPRTGVGTLRDIRVTRAKTGSSDLPQYERVAGKIGLNGVVEPFWRDWKFADPSKFLAPDVLHQWHKFFWDHIMKWTRTLFDDDEELNLRYRCLQKHIQHRHFSTGFTTHTQHTCREHRELEASFIAVIEGRPNITPGVMKALRALLDFIYLGQLETHTTETIRQLEEFIKVFHDHKQYLSALGIRNGIRQKGQFHIPKLELMNHVGDFIRNLGSVMQYTTEHTERFHLKTKQLFRFTNKKDFQVQICLQFDRYEKIELFAVLLEWKARRLERQKHSVVVGLPTKGTSSSSNRQHRKNEILPFIRAFIPSPPRDAFQDDPSISPQNDTTAFVLTDRITHGDAKVGQIARIYRLPTLREAIEDYYERQLEGGLTITFLDCWDRVRLQLRSSSDYISVMPPIPILACAPSTKLPYGLCNFVMVKEILELGLICLHGHFAAQLRLVFQPLFVDTRREPEYLAYIEPLQPAPGCVRWDGANSNFISDESSQLYRTTRLLNEDGSRRGVVVNLTDIWRPVDVVPAFGENCPSEWTTDNAIELAETLYINPFYDKSMYNDIK